MSLTLPDDRDSVTVTLELANHAPVPFNICLELRLPKFAIGLGGRRTRTACKAMPEAPMREDCELRSPIRDIRRSRQITVSKRVPETQIGERPLHRQFRCGAGASNAPHQGRSFRRGRKSFCTELSALERLKTFHQPRARSARDCFQMPLYRLDEFGREAKLRQSGSAQEAPGGPCRQHRWLVAQEGLE